MKKTIDICKICFIFAVQFITKQLKFKKMTTLKTLFNELPKEIIRIKEMANTLQGFQTLKSIYELQFNESYTQGDNLIYEIARVNVLRKINNKPTLC